MASNLGDGQTASMVALLYVVLAFAVPLVPLAGSSPAAPHASGAGPAVTRAAGERPRSYWQAIAENGMALPEGESAFELLVELSSHLGSPDPVLRDDYAYGIAAAWIQRQQLLDEVELRALVELWSSNLGVGIGEPGPDSVLLRSFSALNLSLLAAYDNQHRFLDDAAFEGLLSEALVYLERERDLRGWVPGLGWCHSAAHTADLLKFLARSEHLEPAGQFMILEGIANRLRDTDGYVFVHGEDERLAAAVVSVMAREDFDTDSFAEFLGRLAESARQPQAGADFDPVQFAGQQNSKNLARALYVHLVRAGELPSELEAARGAVLQTLESL